MNTLFFWVLLGALHPAKVESKPESICHVQKSKKTETSQFSLFVNEVEAFSSPNLDEVLSNTRNLLSHELCSSARIAPPCKIVEKKPDPNIEDKKRSFHLLIGDKNFFETENLFEAIARLKQLRNLHLCSYGAMVYGPVFAD